ncbi:MAG: hypothetical protein IT542_12245 [Rubellimicrobium sp.]|nr:hypothetical protein [Rubellimicrobium sp.]
MPKGRHRIALIGAIETGDEPANGARGNLVSLATCLAAIEAARTGTAQVPGQVRARPDPHPAPRPPAVSG